MEFKLLKENEVVARNTAAIINLEPVGEKDESQDMPNLVETLTDITETEIAQQPELKIPEFLKNEAEENDTAETHPSKIRDANDVENDIAKTHPHVLSDAKHIENDIAETHPHVVSDATHTENDTVETHPHAVSDTTHIENNIAETHPHVVSDATHIENDTVETHPHVVSDATHVENDTAQNHQNVVSDATHIENDIIKTYPHVISNRVHNENTLSNSDVLETDRLKCLPKQRIESREEQRLSDSNDNTDVSKVKARPFSPRLDSLHVPKKLVALKDDKRESNVSDVRKASKVSLLSQISGLSVKPKTDFTTIQIPVDEKSSVFEQEHSWIRIAIPYLPLSVAVSCLLLNVLVPGSGTIVSGLCIFCCAKSRVPQRFDQDPVLLVCVNTWVGIAQLFTVTFLLVGWFWSIAWGIKMVILSLELRELRKQRAANELKEFAIDAFRKASMREI